MKTRIKNSINRLGLTVLVALAALVLATGCIGWYMPHPDPIAGWPTMSREPDKAITDDYKDYVHKLPPRFSQHIGFMEFFEDGNGQHAVRITFALNGTFVAHIIIYSKDDKRIQVIKYVSGHYMS
jgi:hypothetical protein